jgi:hypothetical protein
MSNKGIRLNNVVRLHRADQRRLEDLVQEQYVTSGINQNHVAGAREVFGIKSNRDVLRNAVKSDGTLVQRVSKLERELSALRAAFDVFKHGCRGDKS